MKKLLIVFLWILQTCEGQAQDIGKPDYSGLYTGSCDEVSDTDVNHIIVKLWLYNDSTYYYEIGGVFSWCRSATFNGWGNWFAEADWIYFKPDTIEAGSLFVMAHPVVPDRNKEENARMFMHWKEGYDHALRVTTTEDCNRIYLRIAWDCFESWEDGSNFIRKINGQ
jgi:hypothetical protein